jgi:hypothetical protein
VTAVGTLLLIVRGMGVYLSRLKTCDRWAATCVLSQQKIFSVLVVFSKKSEITRRSQSLMTKGRRGTRQGGSQVSLTARDQFEDGQSA